MRVRPRSPEQVSGTDQGTTLRVWLLGAFRVAVGSRIIDDSAWRLRKARDLIKLLALAPGHRLHRERVIEALWSGVDLAAAGNSLYQILHFARHTLQPNLPRRKSPAYLRLHDDIIVLGPSGQVHVDVTDFEAAASAARITKGRSAYRAALDLYAGDLLPDDVYDEWAAARRDGLQQLRQALRLELAGSHEEHEEFDQALTVLGDVLEQDPLSEEAHARLMRLHALSGDRHKALGQYERLQEVLARELGVKPDSTTQGLYEDIKTGRFSDRAADVGQLEDAATDAVYRKRLSRARTPASKRAMETLPGNLPTPLTSFVGRETEVADVKAGLSRARLVTLLGPGGSGKTRLALRVAAEVTPEFPEGVWFIDLAPLTDPSLIPRAVATVLGVKEQSRRPLVDTLVESLKPQRVLLILDNCEHLTQSCADLCIALLQACPELRLLTTTREALKVHGEMKWSVPPLALPEKPARPSLDKLSQYDAVQLFVERARLSRPAFRLTETNAAPTLEICRRLDGLPLAIELTAARLNVLSLEEIVNRLSASLRLLTVDERGVPDRHRTAHSAIDWSYHLLERPEQTLLNRMSVFSGSFNMEAVEQVCVDQGDRAGDVLDLLSRLVDKSMLLVDEARDGSVRYRLLEIIREYGGEQLTASGESEPIRHRHARFFADLAARFDPMLQEEDRGTRWGALAIEDDNLRAAVRRAIDAQDADTALRLGQVLGYLWIDQGYFVEGLRLLLEILALPEAQEPTLARSRTLRPAGSLAWAQGDFKVATSISEEILAIATHHDDQQGCGQALSTLGLIARAQGDHATAHARYKESLAKYEALNDDAGVAMVLNNLGYLSLARGDTATAGTFFERKLEIERARGSNRGVAYALNGLGIVAEYQDDFTRAQRAFEEALALRREMGDKAGVAATLTDLGQLTQKRGEAAAARGLFEEGLAIRREIGDRPGVADSLGGLGMLAVKQGDYAAARTSLVERIMILRDLGAPHGVIRALDDFAVLAAVQYNHHRAIRLAASASALREKFGAAPRDAKRTDLDRRLKVAQGAVGDDNNAIARAQGEQMTLEQAIEFAIAATEAVSSGTEWRRA
jgi:predicted ATPase/DNA-binding SARP family transcriptional activator